MECRETKVILIIDDNVTNLKVAIEQLKGEGMEIIIARSGESGLERAKYAKPNLILLDVQMPGIDGFETCRLLKQNPATQDIPVIFMTALADVSSTVRGFEVGGVDYITKPIQAEVMLARVRTHLKICQLQHEMMERVTELDAFAHTVAHDLKNPIARIVGGLEVLRDLGGDVLNEQMHSILEISMRGSRQMVSIIDELLLLASIRQEEVPLESVAMTPIINKAVQRLADMIDQYEAEVIVPESLPAAVGYAPWLEEVWVNYVSNALKYGGRPPRLEFGAEPDEDGQIRFWIQDNGAGLTADQQEQLFKAFSRVQPPQHIKGHGLGLSIVARILRRLDGEVGVESRPEHGSRFFFVLPAAAVDSGREMAVSGVGGHLAADQTWPSP